MLIYDTITVQMAERIPETTPDGVSLKDIYGNTSAQGTIKAFNTYNAGLTPEQQSSILLDIDDPDSNLLTFPLYAIAALDPEQRLDKVQKVASTFSSPEDQKTVSTFLLSRLGLEGASV